MLHITYSVLKKTQPAISRYPYSQMTTQTHMWHRNKSWDDYFSGFYICLRVSSEWQEALTWKQSTRRYENISLQHFALWKLTDCQSERKWRVANDIWKRIMSACCFIGCVQKNSKKAKLKVSQHAGLKKKKIGIQYIQEGKGGKKITILCCIKLRQNETEELLGNSFWFLRTKLDLLHFPHHH